MTCERNLEPLFELARGRFTIGISNTSVFEVNNGVLLSSKGHKLLKLLIKQVAEKFRQEF